MPPEMVESKKKTKMMTVPAVSSLPVAAVDRTVPCEATVRTTTYYYDNDNVMGFTKWVSFLQPL